MASTWERVARADGSCAWLNSATGKWQATDPSKNTRVALYGQVGSYDKMGSAHKAIRDKVCCIQSEREYDRV